MEQYADAVIRTLVCDIALGRRSFDVQSSPSLNVNEPESERLVQAVRSIHRAIDSVNIEVGAPSNRNRNRTQSHTPIKNLPIELFCIIIQIVLIWGDREHDWGYYGQLMDLCLVCAQWARTIHSSPEFWTRIDGTMNQDLLMTAISRSRTLPIDVTGSIDEPVIANAITALASRWQTLDITTNSDEIMKQLMVSPAPWLQTLRLNVKCRSDPPDTVFADAAPKLQSIAVWRAALPWSSPVFSNLTKLALSAIENGAPTLDNLLDILSTSPQLQHLEIVLTHIGLSPNPSPRIVKLPELLSFTVRWLERDIMAQVLAAIKVPPSATCTFGVSIELEDGSADVVIAKLKTVSERLVTLHRMTGNYTSTLSLRMEGEVMQPDWDVTLTYQSGNQDLDLGPLNITVNADPGLHAWVLGKMAERLKPFTDSPPPELRFIHPHILFYFLDGVPILSNSIPDVHQIQLINLGYEGLKLFMGHLFPSPNEPSPATQFANLEYLTVQVTGILHDDWIEELWENRKLQGSGTVAPLPSALKLHLSGGAMHSLGRNLLDKLLPTQNVSFNQIKFD